LKVVKNSQPVALAEGLSDENSIDEKKTEK
jgi:hypothetical protein